MVKEVRIFIPEFRADPKSRRTIIVFDTSCKSPDGFGLSKNRFTTGIMFIRVRGECRAFATDFGTRRHIATSIPSGLSSNSFYETVHTDGDIITRPKGCPLCIAATLSPTTICKQLFSRWAEGCFPRARCTYRAIHKAKRSPAQIVDVILGSPTFAT